MSLISRYLIVSLVCFIFLAVFSVSASALTGPRLYIVEQVTGSYLYDGSVDTDASRTGQVLISVPNNNDVLQYIWVNLTGATEIGRTDIDNKTAFRNVQYSPTENETAGIYVNTTANDPDTTYTINEAWGPTINLSMTWNNSQNGDDLFPDDNLEVSGGTNAQNNITFNITVTNPSASKALTGSEVTLYFATNYEGTRDVLNITSGTNASSAGSTVLATQDADNDWDTIVWTGDLGTSTTIYITFDAIIEEGDNFATSADSIDLDSTGDAGGNGNYSASSTLTGITSDYKFARSSIRTGIDLSMGGSNLWDVRGLIRNMAATDSELSGETGLVYNITEWRIYSVDPATGVPYSTANQSGEFNQTPGTTDLLYPDDGRIYTNNGTRSSNTSWFETDSASKPYFSVYFDWHVVWDTDYSNSYTGYVNTTMNLPELYKVDLSHTKTHTDGYISPDTGGESLWLDDNVTFAGDDNAAVRYFQIKASIPSNTTSDVFHGAFDINHTTTSNTAIRLYYHNETGTHLMDISDSSFDVSVTDPVEATNGSIIITMGNVNNAVLDAGGTIGDDMKASDYFSLRYQLLTHVSMTTGDTYRFTGNTSVATMSGTNYTQGHPTTDIDVGGKRLTGYKELKVYDTAIPTLINVTLLVEVETGTGDISGIKFMDYVPSTVTTYTLFASNFSNGDYSVHFYNDTGWHLWTYGADYDITDNGTETLNDGTSVRAFEFVNGSNETWTLADGEKINVSYQMNVTEAGTYILPLELAGFDPATGQEFRAVTYGFIRVDIPEPSLALHITEGELTIAKRVVVGKPALWIKEFEVFNPNPKQVASTFETDVFIDAMEAYVSYYDETGQKVEKKVSFGPVSNNGKKTAYWSDVINALETRSYELRVLTPQVMEIDRDVEVLEKLPDKRVKLKMDIYLKSFAEEDYKNVVLNLPVKYENVFEVRDGFGNRLEFTGGGESTTIFVNEMMSGDIKTVTMIYKESYPTIIITPDRDRYNLNSPVGLEILVINGGETIEYPYLELEIYTPGMDVIFTNIEKLQTLEPLEKTELFERFVVPASAPTGMYVVSAKFRQDFVTLASATGNFYIVGAGGGLPEALEILIILVVSGVLLYFSFKRLRSVKGSRRSFTGGFEREGL